ncbi:telomerase protein component 1-like [Littorina saxatilis]|uniref:Telomerase protein component 1 n=1 Tax=Littorina saxatilis TaxID=31220 RepID=A0AAN9BM54_9CAEN
MYRRFKSGNKPEETQHHGSLSQAQDHPSDPEVERQVAGCWRNIHKVCSQAASEENDRFCQKKSSADSALGGWQTVRIFVSSTFTDFFSEREVLVKKVFPELREWCHDRKLKLVECDLRWGVPKDATSTQALLTCLEEIDRCYEANGQPFFLNMLGERYGWIPGKAEVPEEVCEKYNWVDGTSMTFMEILHGTLRMSNPNAAFFLRDPGFISQLPDDHASRFQWESPLAREHMRELKSQLLSKFPQQVFPYTVDYGGINTATGRALVDLTGMDKFADQVKEFFKAAIEKAYPHQSNTSELTPEEKETELQWTFIEDKAETLIGRDKELQLLQNYAKGKPDNDLEMIDGKKSTIRKAEDWDMEKGDNLLCLVTAEGGWGKTGLLAGLACQAVKDGKDVFYHFVGGTASSRYHTTLVQRLLLALAPDPAGPELNDPEADMEAKKKLLRKLLAGWRETDKEKLIVIDGVNELDNSGSLNHLSWLPPSLPAGLRCVISTNVTHLPTTARLYEHPAYCLKLSALDMSALQDIAAKYFGDYGKKLEDTQVQRMVQMTKVNNPLWMILMCEELRIFGDFRMMDKKLEDLPDTMDAFLSTVVHRLLSEDDSGYVKKVLFLTACSTSGLPTDYILRLLGDIENKTECPPLYWAQARRILKPYSRTIHASGDAEEYFTFVHEAMWKAVRQCMESAEEDFRVWHKQLADLYQYSCDNFILRINYLPYQLQQARLQKRLIEFLRRDPDAVRMPAFQRSRYLNDMRCRNPSDPVVPNTRELMMCQMCRQRRGGFNPSVLFPNNDVCYLCSNFITFSSNPHPARICFVHAMKNRMGPNISPCCVCGQHVFLTHVRKNSSVGPTAASLCHVCGFGLMGKSCCEFRDFVE